jgi:hypothetical protein
MGRPELLSRAEEAVDLSSQSATPWLGPQKE